MDAERVCEFLRSHSLAWGRTAANDPIIRTTRAHDRHTSRHVASMKCPHNAIQAIRDGLSGSEIDNNIIVMSRLQARYERPARLKIHAFSVAEYGRCSTKITNAVFILNTWSMV